MRRILLPILALLTACASQTQPVAHESIPGIDLSIAQRSSFASQYSARVPLEVTITNRTSQPIDVKSVVLGTLDAYERLPLTPAEAAKRYFSVGFTTQQVDKVIAPSASEKVQVVAEVARYDRFERSEPIRIKLLLSEGAGEHWVSAVESLRLREPVAATTGLPTQLPRIVPVTNKN